MVGNPASASGVARTLAKLAAAEQAWQSLSSRHRSVSNLGSWPPSRRCRLLWSARASAFGTAMMHVMSAAVLAALALTSGGASDGTNVAWVALLSGRSENMTDHALLQIASVRRASKHEHVTMVTPDVEGATRARLRDAGSRVVEVAPI